MTAVIKTKMSIEPSDAGFWLVTFEAFWPDGDQYFTFATKHRSSGITVSELERSAIAQVRVMLGDIVGIGDKS